MFHKYLFNLYKLFTRRVIYHTVGWIIYISVLLSYQMQWESFTFVFTNEVLKLCFLATAIYFNILYLVPKFLSEKRYFNYTFYFFVTVLVITPLEVFTLYFKLNAFPDYQDRLVNQQANLYVFNTFALGCSTIFKIISDWVRHQRIQRDLEKQRLQAELRFLRTQINPHFLFNTLNSLYALTLKKADSAPDIVIKLSNMMRYMLYESNEKRVLLAKEVAYVADYVALETLRVSNKASIRFEVQGEITTQQIAPLLFNTFIENSFKHGISSSLEPGFVEISLSVNDDLIHLEVKNSKSKSETLLNADKVGGIGLVNVRRRLNLIYPESYDLRIKDSEETYTVHLTLNLNGLL